MSSRYPPYSWGKVKFLGMFMSAHIPGTSIVKHPVTKENGHAEAANGHTNGHANGDAAVPAKVRSPFPLSTLYRRSAMPSTSVADTRADI